MSEEKSAEDVKNDANIEIWKIKKLIKSLEMARGCAAALKNPPDSTPRKCRLRRPPAVCVAPSSSAFGQGAPERR